MPCKRKQLRLRGPWCYRKIRQGGGYSRMPAGRPLRLSAAQQGAYLWLEVPLRHSPTLSTDEMNSITQVYDFAHIRWESFDFYLPDIQVNSPVLEEANSPIRRPVIMTRPTVPRQSPDPDLYVIIIHPQNRHHSHVGRPPLG